MEVQTYEMIEAPACVEDLEIAKQLIEDLGLGEQKKFVGDEQVVGIPYRKMTKEEMTVFKTLCPQNCLLEKYGDDPIPVRVLQVAAHAKTMFNRLVVWYPENADFDDPILVGVIDKTTYSYEHYILARWGNVLMSYEKLREMAGNIMKDNLMTSIRVAAGQMKGELEAVETMTGNEVITLGKNSVTYYGVK